MLQKLATLISRLVGLLNKREPICNLWQRVSVQVLRI